MSKSHEHRKLVAQIVAETEPSEWERKSRLQYGEAARGLLSDLEKVGFVVGDMAELREMERYDDAIPILLRWLPSINYPPLYSDVVETLTVPRVRAVLPVLLVEFEREDDVDRWAVGCALSKIMRRTDFDAIRPALLEKRLGRARQMPIMMLNKMKGAPGLVDLLVSLIPQEEVAMHAIIALGKLKAHEARPHIVKFLDDTYIDQYFGEHTPVDVKLGFQREAKRAIKKMDAAPAP